MTAGKGSRRSVATPIGFADGEIVGYHRTRQDLEVHVQAWNERRLLVRFTGVVAVHERCAGSIHDLCEVGETPLLAESVHDQYDVVPEDHGLRSFEFTGLDGDPRLEVVAEGVEVTVPGN